MSIDQTNTIDFISLSPDGKVVLTISDHHPWGEAWHLQLMQDKINVYLHFIDSGQILEDYPNAVGREVIIQIVMRYQPNAEAIECLEQAKELSRKAGCGFDWSVLDSDQ